MVTFDTNFTSLAFILLGIERLLYGYFYLYTDHFKTSVRNGKFGKRIQSEPLYWKCAMMLGIYVKIFQFSVIIYDIVRRCTLCYPFLSTQTVYIRLSAVIGIILFLIGQILNMAVFQALGPIGVYYGYQLGYVVPRVNIFPYNTFIIDPQYWGVVLCVWGLYLMVGSDSFVVPLLESFWYIMSMEILEHPRGKRLITGIRSKSSKKK